MDLDVLGKSLPDFVKAVKLQIVLLTIAVILVVTFVPLAAVVLTFLLWRTCVVQIAKVLRPQYHKLVHYSAFGITWDSVRTKPVWNLVGFMILDGKMDFEKLRDESWARIIEKKKDCAAGLSNDAIPKDQLLYPQLQQTLAQFGGYYFWKWDDNFDLKNHVRYYDYKGKLTLPTNRENEDSGVYCTEEDLERVYGGLVSEPWTDGRSMWEFLYVGKFKSVYTNDKEVSKDQCVVAYRIHHAIADGYSIIKMLQDLSNIEIKNRRVNFPKLSTLQTILAAVIFPFKFPFDIARSCLDFADGFNSWHLLTTKLSGEYNSCISKPLPVDLIKRIKNHHGVSYNSVLMAASTGAFCKLMKEAGQEVPRRISSYYALPMPNHPNGLNIHATGTGLKLPMACAISSVDRLHAINKKLADQARYLTARHLHYVLGIIIGAIPTIFIAPYRHFVLCTVGVSCLPGPEEPMDFGGAKMTDAMNACGTGFGKNALSMILMSICGKQRFVAHIDKTVFPSQELFSRFGQYAEEELNELLKQGNSLRSKTFKNE